MPDEFGLWFLPDGEVEPPVNAVLILGECRERLAVNLGGWSRPRYEAQWREASSRLLEGREPTALITEWRHPSTANFIVWWPLYLDGDRVVVQNQLLFMDQLSEPFDANNPYRHVPSRRRESEEGETISEWTVSAAAVRRFAEGE